LSIRFPSEVTRLHASFTALEATPKTILWRCFTSCAVLTWHLTNFHWQNVSSVWQ